MKLSCSVTLAVVLSSVAAVSQEAPQPNSASLFDRDNLMAWCIVPFDSQKRSPEERAKMLKRLGIRRFAYDWRAEHVPSFDDEMEALKHYGIALDAFWFPSSLNQEAQTILELLKRHKIQTELWVTMHGGEIDVSPEEQQRRVQQHAQALQPIVDAAAEIGCTVGLYNHGGWFGEPENQIEIIKTMKAPNMGLVYNLHHGHSHIDRFAELLETMKPYLLALNLNGMVRNGDQHGDKIVPLARGELDLTLLKIIRESGYAGPIGILGHTQNDAEDTLKDNLAGLEWLVQQLDGNSESGPRPALTVDLE